MRPRALDRIQHSRYTVRVLASFKQTARRPRGPGALGARGLLSALWTCLLACCEQPPLTTEGEPILTPTLAAPGRPGTLVPLYAYPTDPSFAALIAHKRRHPDVPIVAVINPGTTGAGPRAD